MKRGQSTRSAAVIALQGVGWLMALAMAQPTYSEAPQGKGPSQFEGQYQVAANVGAQGGTLSLSTGFSVELPAGVTLPVREPVSLRIASKRIRSEHVARAFLPIGPSVAVSPVLVSTARPVTVAYEAKRFGVRAGHRVVLVVERPAACVPRAAGAGGCVQLQLEPARYDAVGGQVTAELTSLAGMRMQFGSVPIASDAR